MTHDDTLNHVSDKRASTLEFGAPFTFFEAREVGLSPSELRTLVRSGVLRRVFNGVYVDSATPDNQLTRTQALAKILPSSAVVTDESAGWVHMVDLDPPAAHVVAPPVTVFRTGGGTRVRRAGTAGGLRTLAADDIQLINGIQVTTPLRTALDLGRLRHRDRALASLDGLMRVGRFTHADLMEQLERFRGMRGVVQLRALAPLADARADSPAESIVRLRCIDFGLPEFEPQVEVVRHRTGERAFLDLANPSLKFAVEFDGAEWHESPEAIARDTYRRQWLADECGWTIQVLRGCDVFGVPRHHTARLIEERLERYRQSFSSH